MRRDMDLVRKLLLRLEEIERPFGYLGLTVHGPEADLAFDGVLPDAISAHMGMLYDAYYIESGTDVRGPQWYFKGLTWEGRDFLDSVREPETWAKTKGVLNKAGGWTAKLMADVAKQIIKGELQKLGVPI